MDLNSAFLTLILAASSLIHAANLGMATSEASLKLNGTTVEGTATLTDGAILETTQAPSRIRLNNGARLQLSSNSRIRLNSNRLVLEQGYTDLLTPGSLTIEARSLQVKPDSAQSRGRIALHGSNLVQVAAAHGSFRVFNAGGVLVSNLLAGDAFDFEPQDQGPSPPSSALGCLLKKDNKWIIYDQATRLIVELQGNAAAFEKEWGNRVQANGTARSSAQPATASTQILYVTSLTRTSTGGCAEVAAAIAAQAPGQIVAPAAPAPGIAVRVPPPAPTSGGGMSAGTKVAIAAAVVGGGGGAAFALTQKSRSN
jgi:hypothetical protein